MNSSTRPVAVTSQSMVDDALKTVGLPAVIRVSTRGGGKAVVVVRTETEFRTAVNELLEHARNCQVSAEPVSCVSNQAESY